MHRIFCRTGMVALLLVSCSVWISARPPETSAPEAPRLLPQGVAPKSFPRVPDPDPAACEVPSGYRVEVVVRDLIYPSSIEFDGEGNMYVAEAGFSYGDPTAPARVLRITPGGEMSYVAEQLNGPVTGLLWYEGRLYISHLGKVSAVENGRLRDIVTGLPLAPGHPNSECTVGPDGKIYFGNGSLSNSGIVGLDDVSPFLHLLFWPDLHDVPPVELQLRGVSYVTPQPMNVLAKQGKLVAMLPFSLILFRASSAKTKRGHSWSARELFSRLEAINVGFRESCWPIRPFTG